MRARVTALLTIYLGLSSLFSFAVYSAKYKLGVNSSGGPDFFYQDNKIQGSIGEIFQCALDVSHIQYDSRALPVARLLFQLESGEIDIAVGLAKTINRSEIATYANPLLNISYFFITANPVLNKLSDLSDKQIAGLRHSNIIDMIENLNAIPHEVDSYVQAVKMATQSRVEGAILPITVLSNMDEKLLKGANIFQIDNKEISFYISHKTEDLARLLAQINQGISQCKKLQTSLSKSTVEKI
ncbi:MULTISPECIES: transporter substrate-binding domain-containing protein [Thalassotalea]|uniref:Transporter substrate-binding domain-containing protein n=1 Tax=Thalassotalea castellviae TaxID=3075612 RepID=A0ABU3A0E0_9GAMM|nr:transporter substrate-binding domain-containing protein [Thalassotalea sp. W431]MDT0603639.1 transporter substrate-binding domain-containing protein [Thalassotalea sp. W431]